jgi:hypothetical protein
MKTVFEYFKLHAVKIYEARQFQMVLSTGKLLRTETIGGKDYLFIRY